MRRNRHPSSKGVLDRIDSAIATEREYASVPKRIVGNHDAPLTSPSERQFRELAAARGWDVHRSGWPDFALTKDGELVLVEVSDTPASTSSRRRVIRLVSSLP